jgi:hypothetical protein
MERLSKTKLKASELEAVITKRILQEPKCAGIIQVYIKATGRQPPDDTWTHTLVSRRTNVPRTIAVEPTFERCRHIDAGVVDPFWNRRKIAAPVFLVCFMAISYCRD